MGWGAIRGVVELYMVGGGGGDRNAGGWGRGCLLSHVLRYINACTR